MPTVEGSTPIQRKLLIACSLVATSANKHPGQPAVGNNAIPTVTVGFGMHYSTRFLLALLVALISACASVPQDPNEYAKYYLTRAAKAGDSKGVRDGVHTALGVPPGLVATKAAFGADPALAERYVAASRVALQSPYSAYTVEREIDILSKLRESGALLPGQIEALMGVLNNASAIGNMANTLQFTLKSEVGALPFASDPAHKRIIADRSMDRTIRSPHKFERELPQLMAYAAHPDTPPSEKLRIQAALPDMRIRKDEIPAVMSVFPAFAQKRLAEVSTKAHLVTNGMDRLEADDLIKALSKEVRGVEWVSAPDDATTVITIEKIRHNEKQTQPRTETVRYGTHQVNIISAALLMPRNASYLYDVTSDASEIEYGYTVTAVRAGEKTYDNLLRGTLRNEAVTCSGARIQNVFGGVSPAEFVANNDQVQRCGNGSQRTGIAALREDLTKKIAQEVISVPAIKTVHEAN